MINCDHCNKEFKAEKGVVTTTGMVFCSRSCFEKAQKDYVDEAMEYEQ